MNTRKDRVQVGHGLMLLSLRVMTQVDLQEVEQLGTGHVLQLESSFFRHVVDGLDSWEHHGVLVQDFDIFGSRDIFITSTDFMPV